MRAHWRRVRLAAPLVALALAAVVAATWRAGRGAGGGTAQPEPAAAQAPGDARSLVPAPSAARGAVAAPEPAREEPRASPGDVLVLVVDAGGLPLPGVPVELVGSFQAFGNAAHTVSSATSGASGIAALPDSARYVVDLFDRPAEEREEGVTRLGVRPGIASRESERATKWIAERPAPERPVRLAVDSIGWIEVELVPADPDLGDPAPPSHLSWVRLEGERRGKTRAGVRIPPGADSARIGPVGLGWELELDLTLAGRTGSLGRARVRGPVRAYEVARVRVPYESSRRVTGVAILPTGERLADAKLSFHLAASALENPPYASARTDAAGRFEVRVDATPEALDLTIALDEPELAAHVAVLLLGLEAGDGPLDVGTVVLEPRGAPERLLAAGTVVDGAGDPVEGAWVLLYAGGDDDAAPFARARTRSDGSFEARGRLDPASTAPLACYVAHDDYLRPEPIEVEPGTEGLRLVLARGAQLAFDVRLDPWVPPDQIVVKVGAERLGRVLSIVEFRQRYGGVMKGLDPGTHRVAVAIRSTGWVLAEAEGETAVGSPLDLGTFDLRGRVGVVDLRLVDAEGRALAGEDVSLRDEAEEGYGRLRTSADGRIRCAVPSSARALRLRHPLYGQREVAAGEPLELVLGR